MTERTLTIEGLQRVVCIDSKVYAEAGKTYYLDLLTLNGDYEGDWYGDIYEDPKKEKYVGHFKLNHFKSDLSMKQLEINCNQSYSGKEIREWCNDNPDDEMSKLIVSKYYADYVEYKPRDNVYYFIDYCTATESYKECGSLNMYGCRLIRDLEKSPRKVR